MPRKLDTFESDEGSLYDAEELGELFAEFDRRTQPNGLGANASKIDPQQKADQHVVQGNMNGGELPDSDGSEFSLFGDEGEDDDEEEESKHSPKAPLRRGRAGDNIAAAIGAANEEEKVLESPAPSSSIPSPNPAILTSNTLYQGKQMRPNFITDADPAGRESNSLERDHHLHHHNHHDVHNQRNHNHHHNQHQHRSSAPNTHYSSPSLTSASSLHSHGNGLPQPLSVAPVVAARAQIQVTPPPIMVSMSIPPSQISKPFQIPPQQEQQQQQRLPPSRNQTLISIPFPSSNASPTATTRTTKSPEETTFVVEDDGRLPMCSTAPHVTIFDSPASSILVRTGPNYKRNGRKAPSGESLYEVHGVDVIASPTKGKLFNVAKTILRARRPPALQQREEGAKALNLPLHFVVNVMLPTKTPGVFSGGENDPGVNVVFSFVLREMANLPLAGDASTHLAQQFFSGQLPGRFKVIGFLDNLAEMGVPSLLSRTLDSFNGKPVMVFKTGAFFYDPVESVYECDVNVHEFPYLVRQSLASLRGKIRQAQLRAAFVLQGESNEELPERLLGCACVRGLDLESPLLV